MIRDFSGKTALVTGAASGIGLALAKELVARGANVALVDRREDVRAVAADLGSAVRASAHVMDVADAAAWAALATEIPRVHGLLHLLINNAGVAVAGRFEEVSATDFEWLFATNFFGVVHGCRAMLPLLHAADEAHVVNVCSSFAWLGFPGKSAYASSKAAVRAFSESLRAELAPAHIGVSLLFPGPVATRLVRDGRALDPAQREAEAKFVANRAIDADVVAKKCLAGVVRNRARIVIGLDYRIFDAGVRLSPTLALALVTRFAGRG